MTNQLKDNDTEFRIGIVRKITDPHMYNAAVLRQASEDLVEIFTVMHPDGPEMTVREFKVLLRRFAKTPTARYLDIRMEPVD